MNARERNTALLLVIDDDASLRLMMRATLQASGFDVVEADNCHNGKAAFGEHAPDLVLLDVMMPDGDGYQVCSALRARDDGKDTPIVMVTGLDDLNSINQAYQAGATDFITKPINWGVMGYRIRYILRSAQTYQALQRSEGQTRALLNALPDLIFRLSGDGQFIDFQAGADNPYIDMAKAFIGRSIEENIPAQIAPTLRKALNNALTQKEWQMCEYPLRIQNEAHFWETRISALNDNEAIAIVRNITRRKAIESQMQLWATVFENSGESIVICDANVRILSVNKSYEKISGYSLADVIGKNPALQSSARHDEAFYQGMWACLNERHFWQGEIWNRRRNGDIYPLWMSISVVLNDKGEATHYIGVGSDMSDFKEQQERIEFLSHRDLLTGLPNRRLFLERLYDAIAECAEHQQKMAVLFLNLDRFQNINDSLGHAVGDLLLQEIAKRLRLHVGDENRISRISGDEFSIMLPVGDDIVTLTTAAEQLQQALAQPVLLGGQVVAVSATIGIAVYPDHGLDGDSLLRNADAALGAAKEGGRNSVLFYHPDLNAKAVEKLTLENQLRQALERNELVLYYQPQIDSRTGVCVAAEALIRWRSPDVGLIAPGRFIPLAEECGLIIPIGEWVIQEAARELRQWRLDNLPTISVAVNISAVQFAQQKFLHQMQDLVESGAAIGQMLELELTESMVMRDVDQVILLLNQLKQLGFALAIDDFGTGYSSLTYLRRLPIDVLKVDQSFVRAMSSDSASRAIVQTVMTLTKALKLRSIAEGVETAEQAEQLRTLGCDLLQGFHFAKPMPAADFRVWLKEHGPQGLPIMGGPAKH